MELNKCCFCDGGLKEDITDYIVKPGNGILSIKNAPALICEKCGEKFFTAETSRRIDEVMKEYFEGKPSSHPILAREIELPS